MPNCPYPAPAPVGALVPAALRAVPLDQANEAPDDLRRGRLSGAAVLIPGRD